MKRLLIITYYWPPTGGSGVQRWLKFSKYLREFGWEPVIYTPKNPERAVEDPSLKKDIPQEIEIITQPIWEPYDWYRRILGKKDEKIATGMGSEDGRQGLGKKLAVWLRGNLFIPDPRKFWIKPSVNFLTSYVKQNPVDAVVSTGPPHSMHLIGLGLKRKTGITWIADFRDPWTNLDFYRELMLTAASDAKHHRLEKEVLTNADVVLSIGNTLSEELRELGGKNVITLPNGFDHDDFEGKTEVLDSEFSMSHIGSFSPSRNHINFWKALKELKAENEKFNSEIVLRTVGPVDFTVSQSIAHNELESCWERIEHVSHSEVLKFQTKSKVLLLMVNDTPNAKGILPGKFFEYLASGRPILCVGPTDGDAANVLKETGAGIAVNHNNVADIKRAITQLWKGDFKAGNPKAIAAYSRKGLTQKLSVILNQLVAD